MTNSSRLLLFLALLGLVAVAPLGAADLSSVTATAAETPQLTPAPAVAAWRVSQPQSIPDWMSPQKPIQSQTGSCSARTHCYGSPFPTVSCTGTFDCETSNGCYVYCDGYEYDCPPFYLCP
jgi:hypothetical protein